MQNARLNEQVVVHDFVRVESDRELLSQKLQGYQFQNKTFGEIFDVARGLWLGGELTEPRLVESMQWTYENLCQALELNKPRIRGLDAIGSLLEIADRARFLALAQEINRTAQAREWPAAKSRIEGMMITSMMQREGSEVPLGKKDLAEHAYKRAEERLHNKRRTPGIETGFPNLDEISRGFHVGPSVLVGSPGQGKSALSLQIAQFIAGTLGSVLYISEEMELGQTTDRLLSQLSEIPHYQIASGYYDEGEFDKVMKAAFRLKDLPLWVTRNDDVRIDEICSLLFRFKKKHDLKFAVIDYIGEIPAEPEPYEKEYQMLGRYIDRIRVMTKRLRLPVLVVAQKQRRKEKEQSTDVISGSHFIIKKAVLGLDMKEVDPDIDGTRMYRLAVTKNRNGPKGLAVKLAFHGDKLKFEDRGMAIT